MNVNQDSDSLLRPVDTGSGPLHLVEQLGQLGSDSNYFWHLTLVDGTLVALLFDSAGRNMRPAAHLLSFASTKESKQRKGDPAVCDPFASLRGNLGCSGAGCAVELTSLLCSCVQTTTASQLTKRVCPAAHPPPRALRAPGASRRGGEQTAIRAFATLGLAVAARSACVLGAERSEGPSGCPIPRVPFTMRRGAQRPADQGSRLSERNAVERVRARPRWTRAPQVARSEAQGRSV